MEDILGRKRPRAWRAGAKARARTRYQKLLRRGTIWTPIRYVSVTASGLGP